MKLLFSDGNIQPVNTIQKTTAVVSGETLDAIVLQFTGTTLTNVKSMFDDPAALEQLTLYNDESEPVGDPFIGYINRIATSIVDESAGAYSVTLTKPANLITRVESLTTAVASLNTKVEQFGTQIKLYQDAHSETQSLITTLNESLSGFQNAMKDAEATCRESSELYLEKADSIDKIGPMLENITRVYGTIQDTLTEINTRYTQIANDLAETKRSAGAAQSAADAAKLNSDSCASSASAALNRMDEVSKEYSDQSQKIEDLSSDLKETAKKATDMSEKLQNVSSDLKDTTKKTTDMSEKLQNVSSDLREATKKTTEMSKTLTSQVETVTNLGNKTAEIKSTVESLIPETDITKMSLEDAKAFRVKESNVELAAFLAANPITSTCHKGVAATYSITKEKQTYLQAMILTTQMAIQAGIEYQPSWNATGEPCSYDWTLAELQQLAFEIESVVRPLVSAQQKIEASINACTSIEELQAIVIAYVIADPVTPTPVEVEGADQATEGTEADSETVAE